MIWVMIFLFLILAKLKQSSELHSCKSVKYQASKSALFEQNSAQSEH